MDEKDIFIVIVLYKCSLDESKTMASLSSVIHEKIKIFVFDNSPVRQYEESFFEYLNFDVIYHHDSSNPGLSVAYNHALCLATKKYSKWILLLDQDTTFTKEYIEELKEINFNKLPNSVVAIFPKVFSFDGKIIAPTKMGLGGVCRPIESECIDRGVLDTHDRGVLDTHIHISGINSGTLLNVFYMNSISGFSKNYSLDMLDHWYFRKIFEDKKKIYLLRSGIFQDLSVFGDFEQNVSVKRYEQMLKAECFFIKQQGVLDLLVFKARLLFRVRKQLGYKNSKYYKLTLKAFFAYII